METFDRTAMPARDSLTRRIGKLVCLLFLSSLFVPLFFVQALLCSVKTFFDILAGGLKSWAEDVWEIWTDPPDPSTAPHPDTPRESHQAIIAAKPAVKALQNNSVR